MGSRKNRKKIKKTQVEQEFHWKHNVGMDRRNLKQAFNSHLDEDEVVFSIKKLDSGEYCLSNPATNKQKQLKCEQEFERVKWVLESHLASNLEKKDADLVRVIYGSMQIQASDLYPIFQDENREYLYSSFAYCLLNCLAENTKGRKKIQKIINELLEDDALERVLGVYSVAEALPRGTGDNKVNLEIEEQGGNS